jgi:hypothetical protein
MMGLFKEQKMAFAFLFGILTLFITGCDSAEKQNTPVEQNIMYVNINDPPYKITKLYMEMFHP